MFVPSVRWILHISSLYGDPDLLGPFKYSLDHSINEMSSLSLKATSCPPVTAVLLTSGVIYRSCFEILKSVEDLYSDTSVLSISSSCVTQSSSLSVSRMYFLPLLTTRFNSTLSSSQLISNPPSCDCHSEACFLFASAFSSSISWTNYQKWLRSASVFFQNQNNLYYPSNFLSNFHEIFGVVSDLILDFIFVYTCHSDNQELFSSLITSFNQNNCEFNSDIKKSVFQIFLNSCRRSGSFLPFSSVSDMIEYIPSSTHFSPSILFTQLMFSGISPASIDIGQWNSSDSVTASEDLEGDRHEDKEDSITDDVTDDDVPDSYDNDHVEVVHVDSDRLTDDDVSEDVDDVMIDEEPAVSKVMEESSEAEELSLEEEIDSQSPQIFDDVIYQSDESDDVLIDSNEVSGDVSDSDSEEVVEQKPQCSSDSETESDDVLVDDVAVVDESVNEKDDEVKEEHVDHQEEEVLSQSLIDHDVSLSQSNLIDRSNIIMSSPVTIVRPSLDLNQSYDVSNDPSDADTFHHIEETYEDERISHLLGISTPKCLPVNPFQFSILKDFNISNDVDSSSDTEDEINQLIDDLMDYNSDGLNSQEKFQLTSSIRQSVTGGQELKTLLAEVQRLREENERLSYIPKPIADDSSKASVQKPPIKSDHKSKSKSKRQLNISKATSFTNDSLTTNDSQQLSSSIDQSDDVVEDNQKPKAVAFDIPLSRKEIKRPPPKTNNHLVSGPIAGHESVLPLVQVNRPTNRSRILLALKKNILAGGVNQQLLTQVLSIIDLNPLSEGGFYVLSLSPNLQFKAIYIFHCEDSVGSLLFGNGSDSLSSKRVDKYFNYDTGLGRFVSLPTTTFCVRVDAVTIKRKPKR
ncbi:hypothetical protein GEMRC1_013762 [Eukaryota sp. GEM-RC1]